MMKSYKIIFTLLALPLFFDVAVGQAPQINNIDKHTTFPGDILIITGSNFSDTPSDLEVWFGAVEGEIISSSTSLIQVQVPEEAKFESISVVNKTTGLTAYTAGKFFPYYNGEEAFLPDEFATPVIFNAAAGEEEFYDLCTCDFDEDGKPDIVATKEDDLNLVILKNTSTVENIGFDLLTATQVPGLTVGTPTFNVSCGDLNGDGKPDIVASRSGVTRNEVFILQNISTGTGNISFAPFKRLVLDVGVFSRRIKIADLDFDGKPELIVTNSSSNSIFIFKNNSTTTTITYNATPLKITIDGAENTSGIDVRDLDGDRKPDIVLTQFFETNVFILKNNSSSDNISFAQPEVLTTNERLINVKTGDLNYDGHPEILATSSSHSKLIIFENNSSESISFNTTPTVLASGTGTWGLDLADLNGDGKVDVMVGNQNQAQINIFINNSADGEIALSKNDLTTNLNVRNVIANDFDGDGKPDLAYGTYKTSGPYRVEVRRNLNCFVTEILNEDGLAICPGQTKRLTAIPNPAATFIWKKDGAEIKNGPEDFLDITEKGTYTVEAITEGGSCTSMDTYSVADGTGTIPGNPVPVAESPVCQGASLELSVQDTDGAVYKWTGPNGFTSDLRTPVIEDVDINAAGLYNVSIKLGDCLSSEASVAVAVTALPIFSVSPAGPLQVCSGSVTNFNVTKRNGYSYQWYKDGAIIDGAEGENYSASTSGIYHVLVTDDITACTETTNEASLTVFDEPTANFTVSSTSVCTGEEVTITNTSTVDPEATAVYSWDFGNNTTSDEISPVVQFTEAGTYNIQVEVSYEGLNGGCTEVAQQSIIVSEPILPEITAPDAAICPGDQLELTIAGSFSQTEWSTGETGNSIIIEEAGSYSVMTTDANGCVGEDSFEVTLKEMPAVVVTASTETLSFSDTVKINAGQLVQLNATGADTYSWFPEELFDDPSLAGQELSPTSDLKIFAEGTLTGGCTAMDSIYIAVNLGEGLPINPQKVFSPDSDINPTWVIDDNILQYNSCTLTIFDERGRKVYEKVGYANDWNATFDGSPLPEGVYYYVFGCPEGGRKAGSVLVVRK